MPRKDLVEAWRDIEDHAKDLAKRLSGKEAATPSRTWNCYPTRGPRWFCSWPLRRSSRRWRRRSRIFSPNGARCSRRFRLPEMTELLITPQLPEYPKIARDVFMLLLDGKLRSRTETLKFLKPLRRLRRHRRLRPGGVARQKRGGGSQWAKLRQPREPQPPAKRAMCRQGQRKGCNCTGGCFGGSASKPEAKKREPRNLPMQRQAEIGQQGRQQDRQKESSKESQEAEIGFAQASISPQVPHLGL